jgi:hypothetical protein
MVYSLSQRSSWPLRIEFRRYDSLNFLRRFNADDTHISQPFLALCEPSSTLRCRTVAMACSGYSQASPAGAKTSDRPGIVCDGCGYVCGSFAVMVAMELRGAAGRRDTLAFRETPSRPNLRRLACGPPLLVPQLQTRRGAGGKTSAVFVDALADRLESFEPGGLFHRVDAHELGGAMIEGSKDGNRTLRAGERGRFTCLGDGRSQGDRPLDGFSLGFFGVNRPATVNEPFTVESLADLIFGRSEFVGDSFGRRRSACCQRE